MTSFLWALLAALCWGVTAVIEKIGLRNGMDASLGVFIRSFGILIGIVVIYCMTPHVKERLQEFPLKSWVLLISGGLLASVIGQLFFYRALRTGNVSQVVPVGASYPLIAFILAALFLQESVTVKKLAGVVLVVAGTYFLK